MSFRAETCLLLADFDDPDLIELTESGRCPQFFPLSLPAHRYHVRAQLGHGWCLSTGSDVLTSDQVSAAGRVVLRRWRSSPPRAIVTVDSLPTPSQRGFAERQWNATILGLLRQDYLLRPDRWSRDPLAADNKIATLAAISAHVRVPATWVTERQPELARRQVWKPIDVDQSCEGGRASTIEVTEERHGVQPCPGFYQELIESCCEVRVGYAFGDVGLVAQYPVDPTAAVDRRYVDHRRERIQDAGLSADAATVAAVLGLNVFTADVLIDRDGTTWWCDVNPDGLFCAADTDGGDLLATLAAALCPRTVANL